MAKTETIVYASAILFTTLNTTSPSDFTTPNTQKENSSTTTKERAVFALQQLGFTITVSTDVMLSISATKKKFESVFSTKLMAYKKDGTTYYKATPIVIPQKLQQLITAIVFAEPMELFN